MSSHLALYIKIFQQTFFITISALLGIIIALSSPIATLLVFGGAMLAILTLSTPYVAIGIMLILAPLRTLFTTESTLQLPLDIGQIASLIFLGAWISSRILLKKRLIQFFWTPLYIPIGIFILSSGISVFSATSLSVWLNEWLKWLIMLSLIIICLNLAHRRQWEWLVFILVTAGVANALVGLYIFVGGSGADHLVIRNGFFRAFGTFGQPNPFGGFLGLVTPLALMASYHWGLQVFSKWRHYRNLNLTALLLLVFYGLCSLILLAGIFASWSRGAWLGIIIAVGVILFALPRQFKISFIVVGISGIILGGLWVSGTLPDSIINRITSSTEEFLAFDDMRGVDITPLNFAVVERLAHWQAALNMAEHSPIIGVGFGNYEVVYDDFRLINWKEPLGHAHNYYLNIFAETGIIGVSAYLLMWIGIVLLTWKIRQHPDNFARAIGVGLLGTWAYLAFHSLIDNLYVNNVFLHLGILLGLVAILSNQVLNSTQVKTE